MANSEDKMVVLQLIKKVEMTSLNKYSESNGGGIDQVSKGKLVLSIVHRISNSIYLLQTRINMDTNVRNYLQQANQYRQSNDYNATRKTLSEAYDSCPKTDYASLGSIYALLGQIERDQQAFNKALLMYNKALGAFQKISDSDKITHTVRHIADLHQELGQHQIAEENYQLVLTNYRDNQHTASLDLANALRGFAIVQEKLGNNDAAKNAWAEARTIYLSANVQTGVEECDGRLVQL